MPIRYLLISSGTQFNLPGSFISALTPLQSESFILETSLRLWLSQVSTISFLPGVLVLQVSQENFCEVWKVGGEVLAEVKL